MFVHSLVENLPATTDKLEQFRRAFAKDQVMQTLKQSIRHGKFRSNEREHQKQGETSGGESEFRRRCVNWGYYRPSHFSHSAGDSKIDHRGCYFSGGSGDRADHGERAKGDGSDRGRWQETMLAPGGKSETDERLTAWSSIRLGPFLGGKRPV